MLSTDYDGGRRVRQLNAEPLRQLEPARHEFVLVQFRVTDGSDKAAASAPKRGSTKGVFSIIRESHREFPGFGATNQDPGDTTGCPRCTGCRRTAKSGVFSELCSDDGGPLQRDESRSQAAPMALIYGFSTDAFGRAIWP